MNEKEQLKQFLFAQTCVLLSGRLGNSDHMPTDYIKNIFEETFKALAKEYSQTYIDSHTPKK
ncbi:hypothetical protein G4U62_16220 [Cronobacter sakazakii]|uniref:hypothetical protein n=1 Tax=Cronobacter sakazakii TaxID=28141 RepID=UPI001C0CD5C1|nr:hypothetical protein [Cronobacter sakazakii]QWR81949.1 hypothetical protein G4U62_16220 [Cronobacter sakazakii]